MNLTKRIPEALGLVAALVLAGGCESLNVGNPNAPDTKRALGDPATVQSIAAGALRTWFNVTQNMDPDGILITQANSHSASWNNFQIRFYSGCTNPPGGTCGTSSGTYPRIEWQNNLAAAERTQIERYWYGYYSALSSATDVVKAIRTSGIVISDTATTKMVESMAVLAQGLALSGLALNYDKAFVVDENTPLDANGSPIVTFSGRAAVRDAALAKLDAVVTLATANRFTVPGAFFNGAGVSYDNVKIAQIAKTMAARTLAYSPRNAAENLAVDWPRVKNYASGGISSGTPFDWVFKHDGCINYCDYLKIWSNDMGTMRVHTRVAHLMDPTTQPDPWNAATNRQPQWGVTSFDKRLGDGTYGTGAFATNVTETRPATANAGTDYAWSFDGEIFPAARGAWHQSAIGQIRYITLSDIDPNGTANGFGDSPIVLAAENDLLWAEGLIRGPAPDLATAATLINKTRVVRGGASVTTPSFTPAAAGDGVAGLLQKLQYEQDVELPGSNVAPFYNRRRIDALEPLTAHEMPVPAKELGVLLLPFYTWGGASNPPNSTAPALGAIASVRNAPQIWAQLQRESQARLQASRRLNELRRR
jgi:hypothetical protein